MVVTPRRHDKVLTHRTANRRTGQGVADVESDSCFDREEEGDDNYNYLKKKGRRVSAEAKPLSPSPQHIQSNTSTGSPSPQASYQISNSNTGTTRRRRKKRTDSAPWKAARKGISLGLFLLVIMLGCSLLLFMVHPRRSTDPFHLTSRRASESPQFRQFSPDAPTFCNATLEENDVEFTLVTQVSADRLWMMEHHCYRWRLANDTFYPISVAVLTNETTAQTKDRIQEMGCDLEIVNVQTLAANLFPVDDYPVNKLRNLALKAVKTSHVVYIDIDFWITRDMSEILQLPEVKGELASDPKAALVIPAFQMERQCHQWRECPEKNVPKMPVDLHSLKQQILARQVTRFDPTNRGGHGSTKYKEWFAQNKEDGDVLVEIDCFLSNRYEPYLVFRYCRELPPFQEPFTGYGKNKMTWVMQLRRAGYTFWQLGKGAFVVHYPHLDSPSRIAWNNAPAKRNDPAVQWQAYKRGQMDHLFVKFRDWLNSLDDYTKTFFCVDKLDDDARLWYDRKRDNSSAVVRK